MSLTRSSFVILGLTMTSSWGNGQATTYRALVRQLIARGHDVLFLERSLPSYRHHRDLPSTGHGRVELYESSEELCDRFASAIRHADVVMLGSNVPEGASIGQWLIDNARGRRLFYDLDTPRTLRSLVAGQCAYLSLSLVPRFDLYLSCTGGPTLLRLERTFGARRARQLYCAVDPEVHFPDKIKPSSDLGYLGNFSPDMQPGIERLLFVPARALPRRTFVLSGAQYPESTRWPTNLRRVDHLPSGEHRSFYGAQRFTLQTTHRDVAAAGYSPSSRLFEAAACGTPIISDEWAGIETLFVPGREIFIAQSPADVASFLTRLSPQEVTAVATRARRRVLAEHTAAHRVEALEGYLAGIASARRVGAPLRVIGAEPL